MHKLYSLKPYVSIIENTKKKEIEAILQNLKSRLRKQHSAKHEIKKGWRSREPENLKLV